MKKNIDKAIKLEQKGDKLLAKGKYKKAIKKYKKALKYNDENPQLYEKLMKAQDGVEGDWSKEEFSETLSWLMKKQELENPTLKLVHKRLTPEWETVTLLIEKLLKAKNKKTEEEIAQHILSYKETASVALIDFVLQVKATLNQKDND